VWEFTISDGAAGFRPERPTPPGVQRTFTATIDPATDHNQESLARTLMFLIGSSQEPGYCLNMTWEHDPPEWNDTSAQDPDLKFPSPDPNGVTVTSYRDGQCRDVATTTEPRLTWTVPVACLDYGAYGCVVACAWLPGGGGPHFARLRLGEQNPDGSYNYKRDDNGNYWELAPMPWDENRETGAFRENCIWDDWAHDGDTPGNQTTDLENVGQCIVDGAPQKGDGLIRYEEYRGFVINGNWTDLDPIGPKDLFVFDLNALGGGPAIGCGCIGDLPGVLPHVIDRPESKLVEYDLHGKITLYASTGHTRDQWGAFIKDTEFYHPDDPGLLGNTIGQFRGPDSGSFVGLDRIRDKYPNDPNGVAALIGHELGHVLNLDHFHKDAQGNAIRVPCTMIYPCDPAHEPPFTQFCEQLPDQTSGHKHLYSLTKER